MAGAAAEIDRAAELLRIARSLAASLRNSLEIAAHLRDERSVIQQQMVAAPQTKQEAADHGIQHLRSLL